MKIFIHKLLEELESKKNELYHDFAGYATIGIGHLLTKDELYSGKIEIGNEFVKYRHILTDDQVYDLLFQDIHKYQNCVEVMVTVPLIPNQLTALTSFCYNIGMGAFTRSTLLKVLNNNNYDGVPYQLSRWVFAGGEKSKILENRRRRESEVWEAEA